MKDITRALRNGHPNWPGDTPFALKDQWTMAAGSSANVMTLSTSTHCGTHLDAPYHYQRDGSRLGEIPLETLLGPCQVIHATGYEALPAAVVEGYENLPERVLFYTSQPARWERFPEDFTALTPELVRALAAKGVKLVGTDSPSVDTFSSKELPAHRAFAETGLYIVEGLNLSKVAEGRYQLICLPLSLPDADASPVRALLLETL
jgi:arylformamidase